MVLCSLARTVSPPTCAAEMSLILPRWRLAAQQDEQLSAEDAQRWLELRRELNQCNAK